MYYLVQFPSKDMFYVSIEVDVVAIQVEYDKHNGKPLDFIELLFNKGYGRLVNITEIPDGARINKITIKQNKRKCITKDCEGTAEHNALCDMCHKFVSTGIGRNNQIYRNSFKMMVEQLKER